MAANGPNSTEMNQNPRFQRVGKVNLSLWNPEFTVRSGVVDFIKKMPLTRFETILDYGAGESPYKEYFSFTRYITLDVEQNASKSIDFFLDPNTLSIPLS